jgi:ATP-binding cassette subfamily B protein
MEKVWRRSLTYLQGAIINVPKSILFILLWLIFRSVLSLGELVSLQVIINTIFGPLQQMGGFILQYREAGGVAATVRATDGSRSSAAR